MAGLLLALAGLLDLILAQKWAPRYKLPAAKSE